MSAHTPDLDFDPPDTPGTLASVQPGILARPCECGCGQTLTGRQKRFASRLCCSRWWDAQHPRVNPPPPLKREGRLIDAVRELLWDGLWRTEHQIAAEVQAFEHSVGARLSELRRIGQRTGAWRIESDGRRGNSRRPHRFRLVRG